MKGFLFFLAVIVAAAAMPVEEISHEKTPEEYVARINRAAAYPYVYDPYAYLRTYPYYGHAGYLRTYPYHYAHILKKRAAIPDDVPYRKREAIPDDVPYRKREAIPDDVPYRKREAIPDDVPYRKREALPDGWYRKREALPDGWYRKREAIPDDVRFKRAAIPAAPCHIDLNTGMQTGLCPQG